ncbi:hypothetical protein GQ600_23545 [Phytophthora cactorum]|nr:hypothetical protein GQ600_23545 [Phytophthora cactorum]
MVTIAVELEEKLVKACVEGNTEVCQSIVVDLQSRYGAATEAVQELLGYAFSGAAAHNQIEIMELLLQPSNKIGSKAVVYLKRSTSACCMACVAGRSAGVSDSAADLATPALLVDTDVVRCFRMLGAWKRLKTPAPEAYRPMLMLLLHRYPMLLLAHVDGTHNAELAADKFAQLVVAHDVVDPVAAQYEELVRRVATLHAHTRLRRHELLVGLQLGIALEPQVAKAPRDSHTTTHATTEDGAARSHDALLLELQVWLVVHGQLQHLWDLGVAHNAARVAHIGAHNILRRDDGK